MTIHIITRIALMGLTISFAIWGIAACGTATTPVDEVIKIEAASDSMVTAIPTVMAENIDTESVDESSNLINVDEEGSTSIDEDALKTELSTPADNGLTEIEIEGLLFMREEEKLARDVYLTLYDQWNINIFQNIAASEQTHTSAVKALLDQYGLEDPMVDDERGVFENADLQALYDQLVAQGSQSLEEAFKVGGAIEEIDILDLEEYIAQTVNADIQMVYESLLKGSRNHLRAFVTNLQRQTGTTYQPQYMPEDAYQTIVGTEIERGGNGQGNGKGNG